MRRILLFSFPAFFAFNSFGQTFYDNKIAGIRIQEPLGWIVLADTMQDKNLQGIDATQLARFLDSTKKGILLRTYYKYSPDTASGLIPTVKLAIRLNNASDFEGFKKVIRFGFDNLKRALGDVQAIDTIQVVTLSGKECLYYSCSYSIKLKGDISVEVRSKYYMVPKGKYFISINLIDDDSGKNCSELYDGLLKSLEL